MAASRASWPLGRGLRPLVRVPRRRDAPVRADALPRQPRGARRPATLRGRLPPQRRSRRSRDRVPRRPPRGRRRAAVLLLLRDRRVPLAAPRARGMDRAYRGQFDEGWDAWRDATFARQLETRPRCPPGPSSRRARRGCRRGTSCSPRTKPSRRGSWSASPRTCRTPTRRSAACSTSSSETGDLDNTLIIAVLRQRRERRRRRARLDQRRPLVNGAPDGPPRAARAHRRDRRPDDAQQLPVGLDDGGQHAVQALEARGPRGRRRRSVHRALPPAARADGRRGIRHQFAHAIDVLPTVLELVGIDAPDRVDGVAQSPIDGTSFAYALRRRRARPAARHAVLRDARLARASITTVGRR